VRNNYSPITVDDQYCQSLSPRIFHQELHALY